MKPGYQVRRKIRKSADLMASAASQKSFPSPATSNILPAYVGDAFVALAWLTAPLKIDTSQQ
jgi:hypothetical protein